MAMCGSVKSHAPIQIGQDRNLEIFIDGEFREDIHDLKGTADPLFPPFVNGQAGDLFTIEKDLSRVRENVSGQKIDESGLSCPIRTDDRGQSSLLNGEVDIIRCADCAEIFLQFLCSEQFLHSIFFQLSSFNPWQDFFGKEDHYASTKDQNQQDDNGTKENQPVLGKPDDDVFNDIKENRSYNGPGKGMNPSQESNHYRFCGMGPVGNGRGDCILERGQEGSGKSRIQTGNGKREKAIGPYGNPCIGHTVLA